MRPQPPGEGAAGLALSDLPGDQSDSLAPPRPPGLLTQRAVSSPGPFLFLHPDVCICVFLDNYLLITLGNNKSGLVTQITSRDELVITKT